MRHPSFTHLFKSRSWTLLLLLGFSACGDCREEVLPEGITEICTNGVDDDDNGLTDCNDPNCADVTVCQKEHCFNGRDDDGDGDIDCADSDCQTVLACVRTYENCVKNYENCV